MTTTLVANSTIAHTYYLRTIQYDQFSTASGNRTSAIVRASDLFFPDSGYLPQTIFPIDANVREPGKAGGIPEKIVDSIKLNPFHEITGEIQIVVKSVEKTLFRDSVFPDTNKAGFVLTFGERDGILDGGHRLFALTLAKLRGFDLSNVHIRLLIHEGLSQAEKDEICLKLNTSKNPAQTSLLNARGIFDKPKDHYKDIFPCIRYKENERGTSKSGLASITSVISTIFWLTGKAPASITSLSSLSNIARRPFLLDQLPWQLYIDVYPYIEFMMELMEEDAFVNVSRFARPATTINNQTQMPSGRKFEILDPKPTLVLAVIAQFRLFLEKKGGVYSWEIPPHQFGKRMVRTCWKRIKQIELRRDFAGTGTKISNPDSFLEQIEDAAKKEHLKIITEAKVRPTTPIEMLSEATA